MQQLADDVVIIAAGRLVRQGPVQEVLGSMAGISQVRVRSPKAAELAAALTAEQATVTTLPDEALMVTGLEPARVGHIAFTAGIELHELTGERADLEQVF